MTTTNRTVPLTQNADTTTCSGCGRVTFLGDRIRHTKGCPVALAANATTTVANAYTSSPERAKAFAATHESDPTLSAALTADFKNHDK